MTAEQIQQCKDKLLEMLEAHHKGELEFEDSSDPVVMDQSNAGLLPGMVTEATDPHDQEFGVDVSRLREMQAHRIEGALQRIGSDEFGQCSVCNKEIEFSRLEADPTLTRCLSCAK